MPNCGQQISQIRNMRVHFTRIHPEERIDEGKIKSTFIDGLNHGKNCKKMHVHRSKVLHKNPHSRPRNRISKKRKY